ncbi:MAG: hypothetical protein NTX49_02035 [Chlamydiae bacterium]|nr:hypothetical protein [Chlamydiota bacterium]
MTKIYIANTQFEWELEQKSAPTLEASFHIHPIYLQLQFLSYLYSQETDVALTTILPDPDYRKRLENLGLKTPQTELFSYKTLPKAEIDCWGRTPSIANFAEKHHLPFSMPNWSCVKEVNSKEFSFTHADKLEGACLLHNEKESANWIESATGPRVLKSVYGLSGRGHFLLQNGLEPQAKSFLEKQWKLNHPVIAEPWVERVLDFSTQWIISEEGATTYLGVTLCKNDLRGSYKKTIVLPSDSIGEEYQPHLAEHKKKAEAILTLMTKKGFFGPVGIDAMIYKKESTEALHPIVEINARKTMGWVALTLQRTYFSEKIISMSYENGSQETNLLPNFGVNHEGKITSFSKALHLQIHSQNKSWKDVYN